jgi:hypothetical protein
MPGSPKFPSNNHTLRGQIFWQLRVWPAYLRKFYRALRSYWNGRLLRRFQDDMVSQKMEHGSAMVANQVGRFA